MKDGYSTEKVQLQVGDTVGVLAEEGGNLYIESVIYQRPTNQNLLFRSRDWLSANQGPVWVCWLKKEATFTSKR